MEDSSRSVPSCGLWIRHVPYWRIKSIPPRDSDSELFHRSTLSRRCLATRCHAPHWASGLNGVILGNPRCIASALQMLATGRFLSLAFGHVHVAFCVGGPGRGGKVREGEKTSEGEGSAAVAGAAACASQSSDSLHASHCYAVTATRFEFN